MFTTNETDQNSCSLLILDFIRRLLLLSEGKKHIELILVYRLFFRFHKKQSSSDSEPEPEPQSIYLEGALPHESQILVADSQTMPESFEPTENADEPAVS